jgi:two-component system sensor histidine kinase CpxA
VKSLFVKIVAWFGVLLLFSFLAFVATTVYLAGGNNPRDFLLNSVMRFQADDAAASYESGGASALKAYLARLDSHFLGRHRLADASGRDVLSGAVQPLDQPGPAPPLIPFFRPSRAFLIHARSTDGRYHMVVETKDISFGRPNVFPYYFSILAVVLLVCYTLAVSLVRPLRQLRGTLSRFGAGDLSARTQSRRHDEFGDVARAFDAMADRIQTLLTAERRLLQDVSHELNSPLARLTVAAELARTAPDRDAALNRVKREAVRISEMVNELIEMTRVEGAPEARAMADVRLTDLLNVVAEDCVIEADAKQCGIVCHIEEDLTVQGDAVLLRRGVENIVRNAIQHAPGGTPVEIRVRNRQSFAELSVRDYGAGVPPEHLTDIFRPFYRVENDRSRSSGGVGLGLAIAHRVAQLHHGGIAAENAGPGLRVTMRIPWPAA